MKFFLLSCAIAFSLPNTYAQQVDTFEVYFGVNETKVSKTAEEQIDKLIFNDVLIHGQKLIVLGYADYVGDNAHNNALSTARAKSVQDYLVVSGGMDKADIKLCIGKGKIERAQANGKDGNAQDRKVQIIIDRLDVTHYVAPTPPPTTTKPKAGDITAVKVNETLALKNIFFEPSTDRILPESLPELETLLGYLQSNKTMTIQIEGHICCIAATPTQKDVMYGVIALSAGRAKAIYDYLVTKGVDRNRMKFIGLGGSKPLVSPEVTDEDRQKNRRVEIRVLSK